MVFFLFLTKALTQTVFIKIYSVKPYITIQISTCQYYLSISPKNTHSYQLKKHQSCFVTKAIEKES